MIELKEEVDRGRGQAYQVTAEQRAQWDKAIHGVLERAAVEHKDIGAERILDAMRKAK